MSLTGLLRKGSLQGFANANPANVAKDASHKAPTLARIAALALANAQNPPANDPVPTPIKGQALSPARIASDDVIDIGTIRPPGLSPALLAASLALDAQIHAAELAPGNPDADCWPHSSAMNGGEIDMFMARLSRFTSKGVNQSDAESLADKLVIRDRDSDDRTLCLECTHLGGYGQASWRCANWQMASVAIKSRDNQLPADLVLQLQRCAGMNDAFKPTTKVSQ